MSNLMVKGAPGCALTVIGLWLVWVALCGAIVLGLAVALWRWILS